MSFKKTLLALASMTFSLGAVAASDTGVDVDISQYENRTMLPDMTVGMCDTVAPTLVHIKDNLYRHTNGAGLAVHSGLVMITDEGAVVVDGGATCAAEWLNNEIKTRFNVPVKYVVLTHAHADHMAGSQVFQKAGATIVANQRAVEPIVGEKLPYAVPNRVFDKDMTISIGGETVELHRVAPSHSDSMIMVLFPRQKALQCTDVCESKSMPYNDFLDFYYPGWIDTLNWVLEQDVDVIDVGHYGLATKEDERALRDYMVDLHDQVLHLVREGQSWDQLYRNVKFSPDIQDWIGFNNMKTLNIVGMYRWVSNHRRGEW
ncbi:MBL fold metallo-hydrolase [Otariodibacter oris]|uniref:Glyoxylase-like metal-dependent hydrolase (Beta-lactamase superfamily II) n=1 Tax=Otariodibacter oris TaxID=1032623 RepID=A0A420XJ80_9PAST|nr:MBL fold metallo-hydrolase [Otariodibacter oris]QGM80642.1 MBL fold metallo-hydrolase [Otariodibacter oris]RKR77198.1 glyoxylase-like metal-dependent hydrolase (beta-lactamase superfamily II) [Otariodibacter oris]